MGRPDFHRTTLSHRDRGLAELEHLLDEQIARAQAAPPLPQDSAEQQIEAIALLRDVQKNPGNYNYDLLVEHADDKARYGSFVFFVGIVATAYLKAVDESHGRSGDKAWRRHVTAAWAGTQEESEHSGKSAGAAKAKDPKVR